MISTLVTLIMGTSLGAEPPGPQAAGTLPEGGPILALPQDLYFDPSNDNIEPTPRGVPPGGYDEGKREEENLSRLTGGDGGTVAAHAGSDNPPGSRDEGR